MLFTIIFFSLMVNALSLGEDKLIILESDDPDEGKILVIYKPHQKCEVINKPEVIAHVTKTMSDSIYVPKDTHDLLEVLEKCGFDFKKIYDKYVVEDRAEERKIIFPYTKWCGDGTDAVNDDDLGEAVETDKCCRAHDKCDDIIFEGQSNHNLTNESSFTVLNCDCDDAFLNCLVNADSFVANEIGNLYFNVLARKCYEYDHPIVCTDSLDLWVTTYCRAYGRDITAPKSWIWREARDYPKLSFVEFFYGPHVAVYNYVKEKFED